MPNSEHTLDGNTFAMAFFLLLLLLLEPFVCLLALKMLWRLRRQCVRVRHMFMAIKMHIAVVVVVAAARWLLVLMTEITAVVRWCHRVFLNLYWSGVCAIWNLQSLPHEHRTLFYCVQMMRSNKSKCTSEFIYILHEVKRHKRAGMNAGSAWMHLFTFVFRTSFVLVLTATCKWRTKMSPMCGIWCMGMSCLT